jgi:uncharacterized repeat protein (TIGR03803 family)
MSFRIFTLRNALLIMTLALSALANAATESLLYTFSEQTSFWPQGGLLEDSAGNLYGSTRAGGTYGVGTVFELSPPAVSGGAWTITYLYNFVPYGGGGYVPVSDLVRDQAGAFYGTFYSGGDPVCNCGGVYKLVPPTVSGGAWTETMLYAFKGNSDGRLPAMATLALTSKGTLYGVTVRGGTWDSGVIYQLTTTNGTSYTESVLYSFGDLADASTPSGPILLDSSGNLYGVTSLGGAFNQGAVYKYVPPAMVTWQMSLCYFPLVVPRQPEAIRWAILFSTSVATFTASRMPEAPRTVTELCILSRRLKQPGPKLSFTPSPRAVEPIRSRDSLGTTRITTYTAQPAV